MRNNNIYPSKCEDTVVKFLKKVGENEVDHNASGFVRELVGTGIRDQERGMIDLLPS